MNVMLLINSFNLGGAEKLAYDLAKEFVNAGICVYLTSMGSIKTPLEHRLEKEMRQAGVHTLSLDKPAGRKRLQVIWDIRTLLLKHKIDILHTNGQSPDFFGRLACAFCPGCKAVVTIHSTAGYSKKNERRLSGLTAAYTAVADQTAQYMHEHLAVTKPIYVIQNGIDPDRYAADRRIRGNAIQILTVARVMKQKCFLEAAGGMRDYLTAHPQAKWVIVGDTTQDTAYYQAVVQALADVAGQVVFLGAVEHPEAYYQTADCFFLPSAYEGFGIVFVEAMMAQLPVVCNRVGVIPEILSLGGAVSLLEGTSIAQAIDNALQLSSETLLKNSSIVREHYSIRASARQYVNLYEDLCRKARRS